MRSCWCPFRWDCSRPFAQPSVSPDLIGFLQALPERPWRREVRYPQSLLVLMAILGILSSCRSARDLELPKAPCDSTFLDLFGRVELEGVLIQADALHTSPAFFNAPLKKAPSCS